jgi:hypothetical protein
MSSKAIQQLLKFAQEYADQYENDGFDIDISQTILDKVGSITRLLVDIKQAAESIKDLDDSDRKEALSIINLSFGEIISDAGDVMDVIKTLDVLTAQE